MLQIFLALLCKYINQNNCKTYPIQFIVIPEFVFTVHCFFIKENKVFNETQQPVILKQIVASKRTLLTAIHPDDVADHE